MCVQGWEQELQLIVAAELQLLVAAELQLTVVAADSQLMVAADSSAAEVPSAEDTLLQLMWKPPLWRILTSPACVAWASQMQLLNGQAHLHSFR